MMGIQNGQIQMIILDETLVNSTFPLPLTNAADRNRTILSNHKY